MVGTIVRVEVGQKHTKRHMLQWLLSYMIVLNNVQISKPARDILVFIKPPDRQMRRLARGFTAHIQMNTNKGSDQIPYLEFCSMHQNRCLNDVFSYIR